MRKTKWRSSLFILALHAKSPLATLVLLQNRRCNATTTQTRVRHF
jgi:hypothetical protein